MIWPNGSSRLSIEMKTKQRLKVATAANENIDYTAINAVLEKQLDLAWTDANQRSLQRSVGPENYGRIREIISFASNQDAWLNASNLSSAADTVSGKLSQQYPQLSSLAVFKIVNQATYGWR